MLAVIKTGGKQYLVEPGRKIRIEKTGGEQGKELVFKEVLLLQKGNHLEIGSPLVEGAKVSAKVLSQGMGKKKTLFQYRRKARHKKTKGYRQPYTEVEITKIETK